MYIKIVYCFPSLAQVLAAKVAIIPPLNFLWALNSFIFSITPGIGVVGAVLP